MWIYFAAKKEEQYLIIINIERIYINRRLLLFANNIFLKNSALYHRNIMIFSHFHIKPLKASYVKQQFVIHMH